MQKPSYMYYSYEIFKDKSSSHKCETEQVISTTPTGIQIPYTIIVPVSGVIGLILIVVVGFFIWKHCKKSKFNFDLHAIAEHSEYNEDIPLNEQTNVLPYNTKYEIKRNKFTMGKLLGKGNFGGVYEGTVGPNYPKCLLYIFGVESHQKI